MSGAGRTVLVAGASGVIGASACVAFARAGWRVLAVSRRRPDLPADVSVEHLALDLTDADACRAAAAAFEPVEAVAYAALYEKPGLVAGWFDPEQMATNLAMMRNLMDPLLEHARGLRHVSVLQGTKAYGAHVHAIPLPAKEDRPRDRHDNFYWLQEDYIREARAKSGWTFTIWRPQIVFGGAIGVAMNLIPVIGAYAAICRKLKRPFVCPAVVDTVMEAVDADLIGRALLWAAQAPAARDQTFNITNGDVLVWRHAWPAIAAAVGLEPAFGEAPISLATLLPESAAVWDEIVGEAGLRPTPMAALLGESHHYADLLFGAGSFITPPNVFLVSTIKLRQAGFGDCVDTDAMFAHWLEDLAERRILPRP